MTARVDKQWQQKGLKAYGTEAILGTLQHYGVAVDEAGFKALAESHFPLAMAQGWFSTWKGTGQFGQFPFQAAQELWRRWAGDRLLPTDYAEALAALVVSLRTKLDGIAGADVARAFGALAELEGRVPRKDGGSHPGFVQEVFALMGEQLLRAFEGLSDQLAKAGLTEDALKLAAVEEFLVPERVGVSTAMVKAAAGKKDEALAALSAAAAEEGRAGDGRLYAVDGLIHLASPDARQQAEKLLDDAEKKEDWHLAMSALRRVAHVVEAAGDGAAMKALSERARRISDAHDKAHPHHAHHH
jgi:hypothetical protein